MPVKARPQTFLIQEMRNQADAPAQHEQSIEHPHVQVVFGFLWGESAAVAKQVDEADGNAAVDVEDEVVLFGGGDGFDGDGVIEEFGVGEIFMDKVFDKLDTEIGVLPGFDAVAYAGD